MPTIEAHVIHASRTQRTLGVLSEDIETHAEWVVTTAFYKSVHLVEAVFRLNGRRDSIDHKGRLETLRLDPRYGNFAAEFKQLYDHSCAARYLSVPNDRQRPQRTRPRTLFTNYMPADRVRSTVLDRLLPNVEAECVLILGDKASGLLLCDGVTVYGEPAATENA